MKWFIRFFGLKGSWSWACRQMKLGRIITFSRANDCIHYRFDTDELNELQWCFNLNNKWSNAVWYYSDMKRIDWKISI